MGVARNTRSLRFAAKDAECAVLWRTPQFVATHSPCWAALQLAARHRRIVAAGGRFPIDTGSLSVSPSPKFSARGPGEPLCAVSRASLAPLP